MTALLDVDTVLDESILDNAPLCQFTTVSHEIALPCKRDAAWSCRLLCGHTFLGCDPHHAMCVDLNLRLACRCGTRCLGAEIAWSAL